MKILEFSFVAYCVTDLPRASDFYERVLGFKRASVWGDAKAGWYEYEVGPHTLAITNMSAAWKPSAHGTSVAFEVDDFDRAIAELKAAGVRFAYEPFSSPVCRCAIICDPDGNKIGIHKRNAKTPPIKVKSPASKTKKAAKPAAKKKQKRK